MLEAHSEPRGKQHMEKVTSTFWSEMSACEHFVQIYDSDVALMDNLSDFIGNGVTEGEASIVVATPQHRDQLAIRLTAMGIDIPLVRAQGLFTSIDAQELLDKFIVNGWPDDRRFAAAIDGVLKRAWRRGKRIRAF